jgi:hypothetical protein
MGFWQDLVDLEYELDKRSWRERLTAFLARHRAPLEAPGAALVYLSEDEHNQRAVLLVLKAILGAADTPTKGGKLRSFRDLAGGDPR